MNNYKTPVCNQLSIQEIKGSVLSTLPIYKKLIDNNVEPKNEVAKMWMGFHDMLACGGDLNVFGYLEHPEIWTKYENFINYKFMKFSMRQIDNHIQSVFAKKKLEDEFFAKLSAGGATVIRI
jgi:hypothetical protein